MKLISLETLKLEPISHNKKVNKKVILKKGEVPHLTQFAQSIFPPGQIASEHVHEDMSEIFLVEAGQGIVKVDGQVNQIKKGDCIVVEPGDAHEFLNTGSEDLIFTYFSIEK